MRNTKFYCNNDDFVFPFRSIAYGSVIVYFSSVNHKTNKFYSIYFKIKRH